MSLLDTASLIVTPNGYKEGKLYSVIPSDGSGDMSVTRATTATRVNSQGLVELVPYNLLTYSQTFSNAAWTKNNVTLTSGQADPFGGTSAFRAQFSGVAYMLQGVSAINGTASIYARSTSGTSKIRIGDTNGNFTTQYTLTTSWQRITTSGSAIVGVSIDSFIDGGWTSQDIQVYGAQLVEGSVAKDYQKTETRLNIPRLDYSNGTCPSILVEPQRTNLVTYSSSFDNAAWGAIDTTITANTTISPSGIQDAETMTITSSTSRIFQMLTLGAGTYTASIYVKSLSGTPTIQFRMVVDGVDITQSIPTTTDWVRHDFTFTASSSMDYFVIRGESGTGSVAIWGSQLEAGSYATSYIPTTSASVTRNADVISKTGISSLIGQTEGVIFLEWTQNAISNLNGIFNFNYNTTGSISIQVNTSGVLSAQVLYNGSFFNLFTPNNYIQPGQSYKMAFAYKSGDLVLYINGGQIMASSNTFAFTSTLDYIDISNAAVYFAFLCEASFKSVALWKTRLTNTQLAQLTTI